MSDSPVQVRPATLAEADGIARVHTDSWRETYAGLVPGTYFSEQATERRRTWWAQNLSADPVVGEIWVAVRDGVVIGFASSGPAVGPDAEKGYPPARTLQLYTIYLLAAAHGTGIGQELLTGVLGDRPAQLWVAAQNSRAIAFYKRNGFAPDGIEYVDPRIDGLAELRMV